MKIVITGAAGYMGSALARLAIQRRYDVDLYDNYSVPSNITEVEGVPIQHRDIRQIINPIDLSQCDVLFHLAALSGINMCEKNREEAEDINVRGTMNLVRNISRKARIVFASSSAVYGEAEQYSIDEKHSLKPLSCYGRTKLEAENIVRWCDNYAILRFSNIYGHGLTHKRSVTDMFIESSLRREKLMIHGDGRQRRDFVHINDALISYWLSMKSLHNGVYNVGGNEALSINEIAELCIKQYRNVFGITLEKAHVQADCGRQWHDFEYSTQKAKNMLHYEPSFSVSDEIRERFRGHQRRSQNS